MDTWYNTRRRYSSTYRGITLEDDTVVRMVEAESILGYAEAKPDDIRIGREFDDGPATIDPGEFINK